MDEPLIYTSKGNIPEKLLEYSHGWDDSPEALFFWETYKLDGEVVKHARHGYIKRGMLADATASNLG